MPTGIQGILPFNPPQAQFAHLSAPQAPAVPPGENPWAKMVPNLVQSVVGQAIMAKIQDKLAERAQAEQLQRELQLQQMRNEHAEKLLEKQLFDPRLMQQKQQIMDMAIAENAAKLKQQWPYRERELGYQNPAYGPPEFRERHDALQAQKDTVDLARTLTSAGYGIDPETNQLWNWHTQPRMHLEYDADGNPVLRPSGTERSAQPKTLSPEKALDFYQSLEPERQKRFHDYLKEYPGDFQGAAWFSLNPNIQPLTPQPGGPGQPQTTPQSTAKSSGPGLSDSITGGSTGTIPAEIQPPRTLWALPSSVPSQPKVELKRRPDGTLVPIPKSATPEEALRGYDTSGLPDVTLNLEPTVTPPEPQSRQQNRELYQVDWLKRIANTAGLQAGQKYGNRTINRVDYSPKRGVWVLTLDDGQQVYISK